MERATSKRVNVFVCEFRKKKKRCDNKCCDLTRLLYLHNNGVVSNGLLALGPTRCGIKCKINLQNYHKVPRLESSPGRFQVPSALKLHRFQRGV